MTPITIEQFTALDREAQILTWNGIKQELAKAKEREMQMRKHIVESNSQGIDASKLGTQNVELGNGWKLKAVIKDTYKLDTDMDKIDAALDKLENWQAERLVNFTATLLKGEYDKLSDEQRAAFNTVVTISRASPTLTLVPPKGM